MHGFDLVAILGAAAVAIGCGMIYIPAGIIVGGMALMTMAVIGARASATSTGRGEQ